MRAIYLDLAGQQGHQLIRYPVRIFFILGLFDWAGDNHSHLPHKIFLLAIVLTKSASLQTGHFPNDEVKLA
jgi:hypothetical protein